MVNVHQRFVFNKSINGSLYANQSDALFQLDGTVLIKYTGTDKIVSVPASITEISRDAFADNEYMVEVSLPKQLVKIDNNAFSNCSMLEKVIIPDQVTEIGIYNQHNTHQFLQKLLELLQL